MPRARTSPLVLPEILGIGEDHSDRPTRPGEGRPAGSDILSLYLEGGPRYQLGTHVHDIRPPIAMLIPEGVTDNDRQEGRVNGIFALFRGRGLLVKSGRKPGVSTAITLGDQRHVVPCLQHLSAAKATELAGRLKELRGLPDSDPVNRLRRTSILLEAICDYCDAALQAEAGAVHREANRLHDLVGDMALENISMDRIYERLSISAAHAETLFAAAYGITPVAYRRQLRMRRARELLVSSRMNVSEVAFAVGFSDPLYFSRVFRKIFGVTPSSLIKDFEGMRRGPAATEE